MSPFTRLKNSVVHRMYVPLKRAAVKTLRLQAVHRWRRLRAADVVLLSYPKSGRTWLRMMIGRVFWRHWNLPSADMLDLWSLRDFDPTLPRMLVSHDNDPQKQAVHKPSSNRPYLNKKVIVLVRDPRDVIVSWYFLATTDTKDFVGDISAFIDPADGRIDKIVTYFNNWNDLRMARGGFLLLRYEDLKRDAVGELRRIFDFLGYPEIPEDELRESVEFASFDNMRRMEVEGKLNIRLARNADQNEDAYRTRKGKVGGYTDYLQAHEVAYLNSRIDGILDPAFGYDSRHADYSAPQSQSQV